MLINCFSDVIWLLLFPAGCWIMLSVATYLLPDKFSHIAVLITHADPKANEARS